MQGNTLNRFPRRPGRICGHLVRVQQRHTACYSSDPKRIAEGIVVRPKHHERLRFQDADGRTQWLRQTMTGHAQQNRDLHVCRLAIRRLLHESGVFVSVDEQQPRLTDRVPQRRKRRQQNGTIRSVDQRELISRHGAGQLRTERLNHRQQGSSVEQTRFGITFRARRGHGQVRP